MEYQGVVIGPTGGKMKRAVIAKLIVSLLILSIAPAARAQTKEKQVVFIKAGHLIDTKNGKVVNDQGILIEGNRIKAVGPLASIQKQVPSDARTIDLSNATVLPGLADCHTHVLLQGDITAEDYDEQLLKESIPYRTIRATMAARTGLMNGFTAMRDLETERALYRGVGVNKASKRG